MKLFIPYWREVLEQRYKLLDAYSGTEGKLLLSTYPVDLILLDLMLPGLSGEALLAEIRQTSNVPIIVLSAKAIKEIKFPCWQQERMTM